jgi:hypothetical protein
MKTILAWTLGTSLLAIVAARAADGGTPVELEGLKSTAPAGWKKEEPTAQQKNFRKYQFRIAKADGDKEDAEVVVFFFGPGGGGSKDANLTRWKGQFKPPAGEQAKVKEFRVGDAAVTVLDLTGTYLFKVGGPFNPNAKTEEKPDYCMLGVIFDCKGGPYYMRLLGPTKTVAAHMKEFDDWLKNFK